MFVFSLPIWYVTIQCNFTEMLQFRNISLEASSLVNYVPPKTTEVLDYL
jgi:hypothetical protein